MAHVDRITQGEPGNRHPSSRATPGDLPGPRSNPSALIVEADETCVARLRGILEAAGYLAVVARTVRAAREALRCRQGFAIVVLGMELPDGSGLSLLPSVHANAAGARVVATGAPSAVPRGLDLLPRPFSDCRASAALGLGRPDA